MWPIVKRNAGDAQFDISATTATLWSADDDGNGKSSSKRGIIGCASIALPNEVCNSGYRPRSLQDWHTSDKTHNTMVREVTENLRELLQIRLYER